MMFKSTLFASLVLSASIAFSAPVAQRSIQSGTGDATFFAPGLGACGQNSNANDLMVAVSTKVFNSQGTTNGKAGVCGKSITATSPDNKSVTMTILDECPGCGDDDIDLSPAAFDKLADPSVGRLKGVKWSFTN